MSDTAVYIGAGIDLKPLVIFKHIKNFIYVDSQPLTEFGWGAIRPEYERPNFPSRVDINMNRIGFVKTCKKVNNLYEYVNPRTGTTVQYFMSECFPEKLSDLLVQEIRKASVFICCGHCPSEKILEMMKPGVKTFIGDNKTCYYSVDEKSVIDALIQNPKLMSEYIIFNIPRDFPWWLDNFLEVHHAPIFEVNVYKSLSEYKDC